MNRSDNRAYFCMPSPFCFFIHCLNPLQTCQPTFSCDCRYALQPLKLDGQRSPITSIFIMTPQPHRIPPLPDFPMPKLAIKLNAVQLVKNSLREKFDRCFPFRFQGSTQQQCSARDNRIIARRSTIRSWCWSRRLSRPCSAPSVCCGCRADPVVADGPAPTRRRRHRQARLSSRRSLVAANRTYAHRRPIRHGSPKAFRVRPSLSPHRTAPNVPSLDAAVVTVSRPGVPRRWLSRTPQSQRSCPAGTIAIAGIALAPSQSPMANRRPIGRVYQLQPTVDCSSAAIKLEVGGTALPCSMRQSSFLYPCTLSQSLSHSHSLTQPQAEEIVLPLSLKVRCPSDQNTLLLSVRPWEEFFPLRSCRFVARTRALNGLLGIQSEIVHARPWSGLGGKRN